MKKREEKTQVSARFSGSGKMLGKRITAVFLGTMLASAMMGQTVFAEDVPSNNYTVSSEEVYENNLKTGVTNHGIIFNNGSATDHTASIIQNHGFVGDNFGIVNYIYSGGEVVENTIYGRIENVEAGGTVGINNGTVSYLYGGGTVNDNKRIVSYLHSGGTVGTNYDTVYNLYGGGTVTTNETGGIVTINGNPSIPASVGTNYGTINTSDGMNGSIGTNFGTVNGSTGGTGSTVSIDNNFGGTVTKNNSTVTITNNYGENTVSSGVTVTNQFYSVDLTNTANSNLAHTSGFQTPATDPDSKKWLQTTGTGTVAGVITLTPDSGYEISGDDATDAAGTSGTRTFTYSVQKQADGSAVITISSPSGNINVDASTFGLVIQLIQQSTGGGGGPVTVIVNNDNVDEDHHSSNNDSVQSPSDPYDLLNAQLTLALLKGGKQTIHWNYGTSLPYNVMKVLSEHPELTIDFTYKYKGVAYEAIINSVEADPAIQWYGPLYLNGLYGVAPIAK